MNIHIHMSGTFLFTASCVVWSSIVKFNQIKRSQIPPPLYVPGIRKLILFDASGWYSSYYMGFMEFILETYGRDQFVDTIFAGISGGAHSAAFSIAAVHGPKHKTMRYWLSRGIQYICGINSHTCGSLTRGCYLTGYKYYDICEDDGIIHHIHDKYFAIATNVFGNLITCCTAKSADEFARSIAATSNIPIIGSIFPARYRGIYAWDGIFAWLFGTDKLRTDLASVYSDNSTLIFTMMSEKKFDHRSNAYVINVRKLSTGQTPTSLIGTMGPSFNSSTKTHQFGARWFDIGYVSAKTNHAKYKDKIEAFLAT